MSIIKLENIKKEYGKKVVFKDYVLEIEEGESVSIMGASGSGKSTLLNIIGLLEKPTSGNVYIKGKKNPSIKTKEGKELLRGSISYLFQNYGLIEKRSVRYNLMIAMRFKKLKKKEMDKEIDEALKKVKLQGIENQKVYKLSGGEQQRVALAKILLKPSEIILADEPTGSLDEENRDIVLNILEELNKEGKTIVVVTHDSNVAKCMKRNIKI